MEYINNRLNQINQPVQKNKWGLLKIIIVLLISSFLGVIIGYGFFFLSFMGVIGWPLYFIIPVLLGLFSGTLIPKTWPRWYVFLTIPLILPVVKPELSFLFFSNDVTISQLLPSIFSFSILRSTPFILFLAGITIRFFPKKIGKRKIILIFILILFIIIGKNYIVKEMGREERAAQQIETEREMEDQEINGPSRNEQRISDLLQLTEALSSYYKDNGHYPISESFKDVADILYTPLTPEYLIFGDIYDSPLSDPLDPDYWYVYRSQNQGQGYKLVFYFEKTMDSKEFEEKVSKSILDNESNYSTSANYNVLCAHAELNNSQKHRTGWVVITEVF